MSLAITKFKADMGDQSTLMATNREIIARYDEILCEKVSKVSLLEFESIFDRALKNLT